ncbi:hypothetical protein ACIQM4_11940 [Streptomyces sp. NPDC091272]|uniref:hypothetical protein n=1 Tax=Streptomyces sp. NPDC091272 TaxID=3365981 RepID=UPI0037F48A2E
MSEQQALGAAEPRPAQGDFAIDERRNKVGIVQLTTHRYVQLRPLDLGVSWDADPAVVRPLTVLEYLSARVAVANGARWLV